MLVDQGQQSDLDVGPDGVLVGLGSSKPPRADHPESSVPGEAKSLNRTTTLTSDHLLAWRVDYFHGCGSADKQCNLLDRIDSRGQTDALSGPCGVA